MIKDIGIYDNGQGGDFDLEGKELNLMPSELSEIYISLFGGTYFWGNELLNTRFSSYTEETISKVALNSSGRQSIISAMKKDLERINPSFIDVLFGDNNSITLVVNEFEIKIDEKNTIVKKHI